MSAANSKQSTKKPPTKVARKSVPCSVARKSTPCAKASSSVELELPWDTRHRIMNVLDQLSFILYRPNVSGDLRKKVQEKTNDLLTRLTCLAPSDTQSDQSDSDQSDDDQRPNKRQRTGESDESQAATRQLFFEIPFSLRTELVNQLLCNLDAIMYGHVGWGNSKKKIAKRNALLIGQLSELLIEVKDGAADESDPFENEPESRMIDPEIVSKMGEAVSKLDEIVGALRTEVASLRENLKATRQKTDASKPDPPSTTN